MCAPKWTGRRGRGYGQPADVWSFGIVMYIVLCGIPPFAETQIFHNVCYGHPDFVEDAWATVSKSMKTLIRCLLMVGSYDRISLANVSKHEYFALPVESEKPSGFL